MKKISLGYNAVPKSAKKLIDQVWKSGQFSPGPKVKEFEKRFSALHGAKHAIFLNSGTDALRLSLLALKELHGWQDGDQVAVPSLTFVATLNAVIQAGLRPFLVDVDMYDFTMNPDNLQRRIETGFTRLVAIIPVHLFGQSCDPRLYDLAKKYKLKVIEDSCETILNPIRGDVSCHSTYMAHHLTTGVGGFALTNDPELAMLIRSYANHGRSIAYIPGHTKPALSKYLLTARFRFDRIGYSCRPTEFEAALGIAQIDELGSSVIDRRDIFLKLWAKIPSSEFAPRSLHFSNSCMMFPLVLREDSKIDKYDLCFYLEKHGIETRDMMPITTQPCYKGMFEKNQFSVAEWVNKKGFYIPCHPGVTDKDVAYIAKTFKDYFRR